MTFHPFSARPFLSLGFSSGRVVPGASARSALAVALLIGAPAPLLAQDLSQMPQQSVLDTPGSRPSRPVVRPVYPQQAPSAAPVPMVSNPVVQAVPSVSRPVVQPLPAGDGKTLDAALARFPFLEGYDDTQWINSDRTCARRAARPKPLP